MPRAIATNWTAGGRYLVWGHQGAGPGAVVGVQVIATNPDAFERPNQESMFRRMQHGVRYPRWEHNAIILTVLIVLPMPIISLLPLPIISLLPL